LKPPKIVRPVTLVSLIQTVCRPGPIWSGNTLACNPFIASDSPLASQIGALATSEHAGTVNSTHAAIAKTAKLLPGGTSLMPCVYAAVGVLLGVAGGAAAGALVGGLYAAAHVPGGGCTSSCSCAKLTSRPGECTHMCDSTCVLAHRPPAGTVWHPPVDGSQVWLTHASQLARHSAAECRTSGPPPPA
jgi:hypothetical protein